eukprot:GEMP01082865.1.p2 GENE.GEMP01082865.1~~GEMP01082865.1.p2  ORF type:complete len:139 (+),score=23.43 GEMP01082865.1:411-827(+)
MAPFAPPTTHSFHCRSQALQPRLLSPSYPSAVSRSTEPKDAPYDAVPTHALYLQRHRQSTHAPSARILRPRSASVGSTPRRSVGGRYSWLPSKQLRVKRARRDACTVCSVAECLSFFSAWAYAPACEQEPATVPSTNI